MISCSHGDGEWQGSCTGLLSSPRGAVRGGSGTLQTVPSLLPPVRQGPCHGGSEWDRRVPQASRGWRPGCGLSSDETVSTECLLCTRHGTLPALQISSHRSITDPWLHFADGNTEAQKGKNTCKDHTASKCQCLNQTQVFRRQTHRALLVTDSHSELSTPHCETHGAGGPVLCSCADMF